MLPCQSSPQHPPTHTHPASPDARDQSIASSFPQHRIPSSPPPQERSAAELEGGAEVVPGAAALVAAVAAQAELYLLAHVESDVGEATVRGALEHAGLLGGRGTALPAQRLLFCGTLDGKASMVRQLEPQLHIDAAPETVGAGARGLVRCSSLPPHGEACAGRGPRGRGDVGPAPGATRVGRGREGLRPAPQGRKHGCVGRRCLDPTRLSRHSFLTVSAGEAFCGRSRAFAFRRADSPACCRLAGRLGPTRHTGPELGRLRPPAIHPPPPDASNCAGAAIV